MLAAGLFATLLKALDDDLQGLGLLALVVLATVGGLLVVEAWYRAGGARSALALTGVCAVAAPLIAAAMAAPSQEERAAAQAPARQHPTPRRSPPATFRSHPLRAAFVAGDPGVFEVAFPRPIGLPADGVGWRELIAAGGTDVSESTYRATFANRSDRPLTITDVHVQVLGSEPPPQGSFAFAYAQGENALRRLFATIMDNRPGSNDWLYATGPGSNGVPYFGKHYVSLKPGEIYETTITLGTELIAEIRYRFVVSGSTPTGEFIFEDPQVRRISGLQDYGIDGSYARYYVSRYLLYLKYAMRCPGVELHDWYATSPAHPLSGTCDY